MGNAHKSPFGRFTSGVEGCTRAAGYFGAKEYMDHQSDANRAAKNANIVLQTPIRSEERP